MGTEESRETKVSSFEEVIQKTRELTALLKEDERYQEYCRSLERLKSPAGALQRTQRVPAKESGTADTG